MTRDEAAEVVADLFESWYSTVVRYACRLTGSVELAEDVVQEAFLMLCSSLMSGAEIESPKGWTLQAVRHLVSKHMYPDRKRGVTLEPLEHYESLHLKPGFGDFGASPDVELDDVTRLFSVLSGREEEVIVLRMEGMKYREIGEHLGISDKSVSTLLARALRKLQEAARSREKSNLKSGNPEHGPSKTPK